MRYNPWYGMVVVFLLLLVCHGGGGKVGLVVMCGVGVGGQFGGSGGWIVMGVFFRMGGW